MMAFFFASSTAFSVDPTSSSNATNTEKADAAPGPCCQTCDSSHEKYYSIPNPDEPNGGECGECCLKPSLYWFWLKFEPKLLNGSCASHGYTVYNSTERDGVGPLAVTNDRYTKP